MSNEKYNFILEFLSAKQEIGFEDSFTLAKMCSELLINHDTEYLARDLIIRALDSIKYLHVGTHEIWNSLVEKIGLYPYFEPAKMSSLELLHYELHKSNFLENVYLHREQMQMSLALQSKKSLIVSAPTSFGKSILIEEIIASKKYNNIVIIQPTLALLDETRKKLQKYRDTYNIVVSTNQKDLGEKNIFLFTGERVNEYKYFPNIDFFVIDEFYKLSIDRDDERAIALNHALYRLLKMTNNFYMLGPNIKSIPDGFHSKYNAEFIKTDFATVAVDNFVVEGISHKSTTEEKEATLFNLLPRLKDSTLIYCSSPDSANKLAEKFLNYCKEKNIDLTSEDLQIKNLTEWIDDNIHKGWLLRRSLPAGIGLHHGSVPRHLSSSIIDLFNKGIIRYLFCTSTLIEGVNTSAKNVIFFHNKKGVKNIDYFDAKNIVGRAGRMKWHYVGNIYNFNKEPEITDVTVDIPMFTQDNAPLDLLIQMEKEDLKSESVKKIEEFNSLDIELQELLKENKGIPVEGQLELINRLKNDLELHPILSWEGIPELPQLQKVIELGLDYLLRKGDSRKYSAAKLAVKIIQSIEYPTMRSAIEHDFNNTYWKTQYPNPEERLQHVIQEALDISQNWFEFKLPKLISIFNTIQAYVYKQIGLKPGKYENLVGFVENQFLPAHLLILLDYGIPPSAIRKLNNAITQSYPINDLISKLKSINFKEIQLLNYEIEKINFLTKT